MPKAIDLMGQRFGRLTVVGRAPNEKDQRARWHCVCDCGREPKKPIRSYDLRRGAVRSCGCLYRESNKGRNRTHGMADSRPYRIWSSMKQRCFYRAGQHYHNYGGRGITVCDEWRESFAAFYEWAMANGYRDDLTLDRIDTNGNYEPSNCRWATYKEQENNRRNNVITNINGEKKTLAELSEESGIPRETLASRIKAGWPDSDLLIPVNLNNKNIRRKYYE